MEQQLQPVPYMLIFIQKVNIILPLIQEGTFLTNLIVSLTALPQQLFRYISNFHQSMLFSLEELQKLNIFPNPC